MFIFPISELRHCITKAQISSHEREGIQKLVRYVINLEVEFDKAKDAYALPKIELSEHKLAKEFLGSYGFYSHLDVRKISILPTANEIKDQQSKLLLQQTMLKVPIVT